MVCTTMSRRLWCLAILLVLTLPSCSEFDSLEATFMVKYTTEFKIDPMVEADLPFDISTPPIAMDWETKINSPDTERLKHVQLDQVVISVKHPHDRDLSFLRSLHAYIKAKEEPDKLLAFREGITDDAGQAVALKTSDDDFYPYVAGDSCALRFRTVTDKVISDEVEILVETHFLVVADLWSKKSGQ